MNGIDYNAMLGNLGLFSNQQTADKEIVKFSGSIAGVDNKANAGKTNDKRQTNTDKDTYEYSGAQRSAKAGYERPRRTEAPKEQQEYKALDSNGVQEGIKLSDAAQSLLDELREKYGDMDIAVAEWSSDEEQDYYASLSRKQYSVLINPELLEKMAADESVREKYEAVLSGAGEKFDTLKEELGEDADKIKSFSITMDSDGKVSYAVQLLKDMAESSNAQRKENAADSEKERIEKQREEKKKAQEEFEDRIVEKRQETEKIEADSLEDLISAIKAKLHPQENAASGTEDAGIAVTGQAVTA